MSLKAGVLLWSCFVSYSIPAVERIDSESLAGKLIMGYQGWFACPGDADGHGWIHWFDHSKPLFDLLPDVTEFPKIEKCATPLVDSSNRPINVFSSQALASVERHFKWMADYNLDGVALQRFGTQILLPEYKAYTETQLSNVRRAAEDHGRVFFLMYDLSNMPMEKLLAVAEDWAHVQRQGVTKSKAYQRHRGHTVLGIWGVGFAGQSMTPPDLMILLDALEKVSEPYGGVTFLGGVPLGWRTGTRGADASPEWRKVYSRFAVISPWVVGAFSDEAGADAYRDSEIIPDIATTKEMKVDYMPVVFPGFSWANLKSVDNEQNVSLRNGIPRRCGKFYWRQVVNAKSAGASMLYGAMFDEVNEGTAMFKMVAARNRAPTNPWFMTLDADGCQLPSDWYLRLAGAATQVVGGERSANPDFPFPLP